MTSSLLRYDQMIEEALRGVVRRALKLVEAQGLPANHHFFITFQTQAAGVELSQYLRDRYPDEMTIVLQYQFWNLEVTAEGFAVTLSFNDVPERLTVPFAAMTGFADPSAKFGLQFQQATAAEPEDPDALPPAVVGAEIKAERPAAAKPAVDEAAQGSKVVALDSFRRKE